MQLNPLSAPRRLPVRALIASYLGEFREGGEYVGDLHKVAAGDYRVRLVRDCTLYAESQTLAASQIERCGSYSVSASQRVNQYRAKA